MQPAVSDAYDPEQFHDRQEEGSCVVNVFRHSVDKIKATDATLPLCVRIDSVFEEIDDFFTSEHQVRLWLKYVEQCLPHASESDTLCA